MPATYVPGPHGPVVMASASSVAWTPASLGAALVAYWDADVGVSLSGSSVLTWTDQSSNAYILGLNTAFSEPAPTSPTFGAASFGGKAGLTFAQASGNYLATTLGAVSAIGTTHSWFVAASMNSATIGFGRIISCAKNSFADYSNANSIAAILRDTTNNALAFYSNGTKGTAYSVSLATRSRFGVVFDGVNGTPYLNNAAQTASAATPNLNAAGNISIGNASNASSAFFDGVIRRIVVTNSAVSSTDRSNIDTWLQG